MGIVALSWIALALVLFFGLRADTVAARVPAVITWDNFVGPLFGEFCVQCHSGSGGLYLETYADALRGGDIGPVIIPGNGDGSPLVRILRRTYPVIPAAHLTQPPLPAADITRISNWITAGAPVSR
jgi:hypothetical protein